MTTENNNNEISDAQVTVADEFEAVAQRSLWADAYERLARNKAAMLGLIISSFIMIAALFGPYIKPYDDLEINLFNIAQNPNPDHWLGTDLLGRDVMSRMLMGARTAVFVAVLVSFISNVMGVVLGAVAAYFGKALDDLIMRVADVTFAFPDLLLAAFISSTARRPVIDFADKLRATTGWEILESTVFIDYTMVFGALAIVSWAGVARLIRGQVLSLREQDFIRAEVALGATDWRIIRKHLIPNSIAPVIVSISAGFGGVMLLESSLSFLGLGIQPPGASWGNMVSSNMDKWRAYPLLVAIPGVVLAVAVFGFNFLGDGVNDAINPRQIKR